LGYGRGAAGIEHVELRFRPEVTVEGARSTIVRRQQEDHDGESEEEEKQEGQKGQEGRSGKENLEEGSQEVREEVRQEIYEEVCQKGCAQEGCEDIGQEGSQEGRAEEGREEGGTEEGEGSSCAEAVSAGGGSGARRRDKLGDAFVFCGNHAGRRAGVGSRSGPGGRSGSTATIDNRKAAAATLRPFCIAASRSGSRDDPNRPDSYLGTSLKGFPY
jgi:hypothetical protein